MITPFKKFHQIFFFILGMAFLLSSTTCESKGTAQNTDETIANHSWIPDRINGIPLKQSDPKPSLEFELSEMRFFGTDGCNRYFGTLEIFTTSEIRFGLMAGTKMMCEDMTIPDRFAKAIMATTTYKLQDNTLTFFDSNNKETIRFLIKE